MRVLGSRFHAYRVSFEAHHWGSSQDSRERPMWIATSDDASRLEAPASCAELEHIPSPVAIRTVKHEQVVAAEQGNRVVRSQFAQRSRELLDTIIHFTISCYFYAQEGGTDRFGGYRVSQFICRVHNAAEPNLAARELHVEFVEFALWEVDSSSPPHCTRAVHCQHLENERRTY